MAETPELASKFLKKLKQLFQSFDRKVKVEIKPSEILLIGTELSCMFNEGSGYIVRKFRI